MKIIDIERWRKKVGIDRVYFGFRKVDGSYRKAVGTRNAVIAEFYGHPEMKDQEEKDSPYAYFDFERKAWRCFSPRMNKKIAVYDDENEWKSSGWTPPEAVLQ